jgi:hypothetical protein
MLLHLNFSNILKSLAPAFNQRTFFIRCSKVRQIFSFSIERKKTVLFAACEASAKKNYLIALHEL